VKSGWAVLNVAPGRGVLGVAAANAAAAKIAAPTSEAKRKVLLRAATNRSIELRCLHGNAPSQSRFTEIARRS